VIWPNLDGGHTSSLFLSLGEAFSAWLFFGFAFAESLLIDHTIPDLRPPDFKR